MSGETNGVSNSFDDDTEPVICPIKRDKLSPLSSSPPVHASRLKIAFNDANNTVSSFDLGTLIRIAAKKTVCAVTHTVI
jgi:hypothetical protein